MLHDVIKQEKKIKKIRKKHRDDMWHVRKEGGSFPTLINSIEGKSKGIRKDEKRENGGKERRK